MAAISLFITKGGIAAAPGSSTEEDPTVENAMLVQFRGMSDEAVKANPQFAALLYSMGVERQRKLQASTMELLRMRLEELGSVEAVAPLPETGAEDSGDPDGSWLYDSDPEEDDPADDFGAR